MIIEGLTRRTALTALGVTGLASMSAGASASAPERTRAGLEAAIEASRIAMLTGDGRSLRALLHDRLIYMHSSGRSQTKSDVLRELDGKSFFAALVYSALSVDLVDGVGVVTVTIDQTKNLPGGKTRASQLTVLQIWAQRGTNWQMLARSSHLMGSGLAATPCPK